MLNRRFGVVAALIVVLVGVPPAVAQQPCPGMPAVAELLQRLNDLRAAGALCGQEAMARAPALRWNERLAVSAQTYPHELARRDQPGRLSHRSAASPSLRERLRGVDYLMRRAAENLASGPEQLDDLLALWLASPDHCANLLEARYVDVGLACAIGPGSGQSFWVLHLARQLSD